jgi:hypothetical protein
VRSQIPLFPTQFILDAEDWPVPVDTFAQWAEWHAANQERCAIGREAGRGFLVETRFVGLGYTGGGDPLLYWTTIWMDETFRRKYRERLYATRNEAFKGHYLAVQEAKREAALWRWSTRLSAVIAEVDAYPLCVHCVHYGGAGRCRRGWVPARVNQARHCPVRQVRL